MDTALTHAASLSGSEQAIPPPRFFAHSVAGQPSSAWQPLADHLLAVGNLSADFAGIFGAENLAGVAGRLHDLGKYTAEFLARLHGDPRRVDHATWGARTACERYGSAGYLVAYAIAGHHAGLANGKGQGDRTALLDRLGSELPLLDPSWQQDISLPAALDLPNGFKLHQKGREKEHMFQFAFLVRMLFSCLVDADYLDTEAFYQQAEGRPSGRIDVSPDLDALRRQLDVHLSEFKNDSDVNRLRADILSHVRRQALQAPGLFSLTVPTGGGKTLASLAFALDHALHHGLRRVIFVIPFTSIVEQNAAVFRRALGDLGTRAVLEHHSAFTEDRHQHPEARAKLKLAMENWDAPIVVTTAVQFFESLYGDRPSRCRKLHNIAGSVVILDEAQTLPLKLLRPCIAALDELARNYRSSIVLCTATQPALNAPDFEGGLENVRELAPAPAHLFKSLQRVRVRHVGRLDDNALTTHLRAKEQVLCIVNNRRHARSAYQSFADLPGARHLTTSMCAKHRSSVLAEVRKMLKNDEPCRLVATSLIEAGVDVDFPTVMRAEAGLDSIAQAAGRCNREGRRAVDASEVLVFEVDNDQWAPPPELKQFADTAREVLRHHTDDPLSPAAIEHYFRMLYWHKGNDALDDHGLLGLIKVSKINSLPLETLAAKFRMIDNVQMPVIIPYDHEAFTALERLRYSEGSVGLARSLQPYLVQVPRQGFDALRKAGAIQPVAAQKWGEQFMELVNPEIYDPHCGLYWDNPTFISTFNLVI